MFPCRTLLGEYPVPKHGKRDFPPRSKRPLFAGQSSSPSRSSGASTTIELCRENCLEVCWIDGAKGGGAEEDLLKRISRLSKVE